MKDLAIIVILICLVGGSLWAVVISPMAEAQADQMQTKNILDIQSQARAQAAAEAEAIRRAEAIARAEAYAETQAITEAITQAQAEATRTATIPFVLAGLLGGFGVIGLVAFIVAVYLVRVPGRQSNRLSIERLGGGRYLVTTNNNPMMTLDVRSQPDRLFLEQLTKKDGEQCLTIR